jgi:hypothetical protein
VFNGRTGAGLTDIPGLLEDSPFAMHDCTYELYLATYKAVRLAARARDTARLAALRARAETRTGSARKAALLAIADAEGNVSRRSKADVCRPLCATRCERGV